MPPKQQANRGPSSQKVPPEQLPPQKVPTSQASVKSTASPPATAVVSPVQKPAVNAANVQPAASTELLKFFELCRIPVDTAKQYCAAIRDGLGDVSLADLNDFSDADFASCGIQGLHLKWIKMKIRSTPPSYVDPAAPLTPESSAPHWSLPDIPVVEIGNPTIADVEGAVAKLIVVFKPFALRLFKKLHEVDGTSTQDIENWIQIGAHNVPDNDDRCELKLVQTLLQTHNVWKAGSADSAEVESLRNITNQLVSLEHATRHTRDKTKSTPPSIADFKQTVQELRKWLNAVHQVPPHAKPPKCAFVTESVRADILRLERVTVEAEKSFEPAGKELLRQMLRLMPNTELPVRVLVVTHGTPLDRDQVADVRPDQWDVIIDGTEPQRKQHNHNVRRAFDGHGSVVQLQDTIKVDGTTPFVIRLTKSDGTAENVDIVRHYVRAVLEAANSFTSPRLVRVCVLCQRVSQLSNVDNSALGALAKATPLAVSWIGPDPPPVFAWPGAFTHFKITDAQEVSDLLKGSFPEGTSDASIDFHLAEIVEKVGGKRKGESQNDLLFDFVSGATPLAWSLLAGKLHIPSRDTVDEVLKLFLDSSAPPQRIVVGRSREACGATTIARQVAWKIHGQQNQNNELLHDVFLLRGHPDTSQERLLKDFCTKQSRASLANRRKLIFVADSLDSVYFSSRALQAHERLISIREANIVDQVGPYVDGTARDSAELQRFNDFYKLVQKNFEDRAKRQEKVLTDEVELMSDSESLLPLDQVTVPIFWGLYSLLCILAGGGQYNDQLRSHVRKVLEGVRDYDANNANEKPLREFLSAVALSHVHGKQGIKNENGASALRAWSEALHASKAATILARIVSFDRHRDCTIQFRTKRIAEIVLDEYAKSIEERLKVLGSMVENKIDAAQLFLSPREQHGSLPVALRHLLFGDERNTRVHFRQISRERKAAVSSLMQLHVEKSDQREKYNASFWATQLYTCAELDPSVQDGEDAIDLWRKAAFCETAEWWMWAGCLRARHAKAISKSEDAISQRFFDQFWLAVREFKRGRGLMSHQAPHQLLQLLHCELSLYLWLARSAYQMAFRFAEPISIDVGPANDTNLFLRLSKTNDLQLQFSAVGHVEADASGKTIKVTKLARNLRKESFTSQLRAVAVRLSDVTTCPLIDMFAPEQKNELLVACNDTSFMFLMNRNAAAVANDFRKCEKQLELYGFTPATTTIEKTVEQLVRSEAPYDQIHIARLLAVSRYMVDHGPATVSEQHFVILRKQCCEIVQDRAVEPSLKAWAFFAGVVFFALSPQRTATGKSAIDQLYEDLIAKAPPTSQKQLLNIAVLFCRACNTMDAGRFNREATVDAERDFKAAIDLSSNFSTSPEDDYEHYPSYSLIRNSAGCWMPFPYASRSGAASKSQKLFGKLVLATQPAQNRPWTVTFVHGTRKVFVHHSVPDSFLPCWQSGHLFDGELRVQQNGSLRVRLHNCTNIQCANFRSEIPTGNPRDSAIAASQPNPFVEDAIEDPNSERS